MDTTYEQREVTGVRVGGEGGRAYRQKEGNIRGRPLDILGGGVSDPKKIFIQEIELEKKIPA